MMHNTCLNSAVSLRCRGSPSSPFNDSTYFLDARFDCNPLLISSSFSSCCCCCCCCTANSNSIYNQLPRINPRYLCNGLRQSTLIQFSPSKRIILNGRRRQSCKVTPGFSSLTDSDRNYYYEKLQSFKEKKKLRKDRYACWGFDDKRKEQFFSSGIDDDCVDEVEILLDLLTEVGLENIGVREKKKTDKKETKIVRSGVVKRNNKAVKIECKEEEEDRRVNNHRIKEDRRTSIKGVNNEHKKQGSSCSSYYSVSSTGEFESDNDVEIKRDGSYDEENVERRDEIGKEKSEILKNTAETYYGNLEWRKKTEKKLDVDSSQQQSQVSTHSNRNSQLNEKTDQSQSVTKYKRFMESSQMDNRLNTSVQEHRGETSDFRRQSNVILDSSRIHEINMKEASSSSSSSSSSLLEARKKNQEKSLTEVSSQVEDRRDERQQRIDNSRVISQQVSRNSETHVTNSENISRTSDVRSQNEDRRDEKQQRIDHSRLISQQVSRTSDTHVTNSENILKQSNITSDRLTTLQEYYIRSEKQELDLETSSSVENVRRKKIEDKYSSSGEELKEGTMDSMKTGRRTTKASSFNVGMPMATSSTYKALKLNPEPNFQESSSSHGEPEPQESPKIERSEILRLDSANQQHESSSHILGEFVKNAEHEILKSQVQNSEKTHESKLVYEDAEQHERKSSGKDGSGNSQKKYGPSDEMWHETGGADNASSSGNGEIVKKGGRSLWNVIGDVVRLRWGSSRSETHTPKSGGGRAASNQSTTSEAWFSGHEHEDSNDEHVKTGKVSNPSKKKLQHEGSDSPLLSSSSNPNHESSSVIQESSFPSPAIRMRRSPAVKNSGSGESDASGSGKTVKTTEILPSGESGSGKIVKQEGFDSPFLSPSSSNTNHGSSSIIQESLFPSPVIRMRRSPAVKNSGSGESDASGSGKTVKTTETSPSDASGSGKMVKTSEILPSDEHVDGEELKRRKFARIDQVSKDRFDEWEEAYNFETEQRKNDEIFMKEALMEARKAADLWEVPVGAVLVQDGKVIARGYNLVEELRDSTAHAEMICIREASSNLHSWRLTGTTLYVTLEPCPMCAGAILQARVDTVVWGAPNKLLGADGSWIRLFPDGNGENGSNKPPAPVHPFHPNMTVRRGVLSSECADVMQQFFQLRRKKKEKKTESEPPTPPPSCLPITHRHHHSKFLGKMHDAFNIMFCL